MFNTSDLNQIHEQLSACQSPLEITYHPADHEEGFSSLLGETADSIVRAAGPGAILRKGDGKGLLAVPGLTISGSQRGTINYLALPQGPEKKPFLELLSQTEFNPSQKSEDVRIQLEERKTSVDILIFIASECPHCPQSVSAAIRLVRASSRVSVTVIDVQRFPDLTDRFQIKSVPTAVLDQQLWLMGVVSEDELAENILIKFTTDFQGRKLQSAIDSGHFEEATNQVLGPNGAEPFLEIWKKSTTSLRMGLLMVVDSVLEKNPDALNSIVPGLIGILVSEDPALRGDTADLLGQIGQKDAKEPLEKLLSDPNPDVAEIAAEALQQVIK